MKKKCIKCGVEKPNTLEFFRKSQGDKLRGGCRECEREYKQKYREENIDLVKEASKRWKKENPDKVKAYDRSPKKKEYFEKNKEHIKEYKKKYYQENKDKISIKKKKEYRLEHPLEHTVDFPDGMKLCCKCNELKPSTIEFFYKLKSSKDGFNHECIECKNKYYQNNSERIIERVKKNHFKRLEEDLGYKLLQRCRTRIYNALKGRTKSKKTIDLIGCQVEELIERLENKFQEGMTWENYGEWHLDHIKPCAMFDFKDEKQQQECFHYTNLQPLWAEENQRKSASYEESV